MPAVLPPQRLFDALLGRRHLLLVGRRRSFSSAATPGGAEGDKAAGGIVDRRVVVYGARGERWTWSFLLGMVTMCHRRAAQKDEKDGRPTMSARTQIRLKFELKMGRRWTKIGRASVWIDALDCILCPRWPKRSDEMDRSVGVVLIVLSWVPIDAPLLFLFRK